MNFSRVIKAMAVIGLVGLGSNAVATVGLTNTFEAASPGYQVSVSGVPLFKNQTQSTTDGWTAGGADISEIASVNVSQFDATTCQPILNSGPLSQVLNLKTEGTNLTYAATTTDQAKVDVGALVKLVGSDTAPVITDATVQTAVYLNTLSGKLNAYVTMNGTNGWVELSGEPSTNWVCLKIEIDYESAFALARPLAKYKLNGTVMTDATNGVAFTVANRDNAWSKRNITDVQFRGTGMVDNFAVTETAPALTSATIVTRTVKSDGSLIEELATSEKIIGQSNYSNEFDPTVADVSLTFDRAILVSSDLSKTNTFAGAIAAFDVSNPGPSGITFSDGLTYYVLGIYETKTYTVTTSIVYSDAADPDPITVTVNHGDNYSTNCASYFQPGDTYVDGVDNYGTTYLSPVVDLLNITKNFTITLNGTKPASGDPIVITDNNSLKFGPIVFGSPNYTVSYTADGTTTGPASMFLIVDEVLPGGQTAGVFTIPVEVTAVESPIGKLTGTVSIVPATISGYGTLFFKGLTTVAIP